MVFEYLLRPLFLFSVCATGVLNAQTAVVPASLATTAANSNSARIIRAEAYTYQMQIAASELTAFAGKSITGLSFRVDNGFSPGTTDRAFTDFEITLGKAANAMSAFSTTFANNVTDGVLVMDGALTLSASAFDSSGSPVNAFGPVLSFDTPYSYTSGDLVILFSHTGTSSSLTFDAASSATSGYGTLFRAQYNAGFQATTATTTNATFAVVQIHAGAIPEPSSAAFLAGAGALGFCASRRRRRSG